MENPMYEKVTCELCGEVFHGEGANLKAEKCRDGHNKIVFSIWDYELGNFINYFNTHDRNFLPKGFLAKLKRLNGRALRGG